MSDNSDRIHRHARWILEAASHSGAIGHRTWWTGSQTPFGCTVERGRVSWDDGAYNAICGLLHRRILAEAESEAVERYARALGQTNALWTRRLEESADSHVRLLEVQAELRARIAELEAAAESARAGESAALEEVDALLTEVVDLEEEAESARAGGSAALEAFASVVDWPAYRAAEELIARLEVALAGESAALLLLAAARDGEAYHAENHAAAEEEVGRLEDATAGLAAEAECARAGESAALEDLACLEARHRRYFDEIGRLLEGRRLLRPTGEPARPDCEEIVDLVARAVAERDEHERRVEAVQARRDGLSSAAAACTDACEQSLSDRASALDEAVALLEGE